MKPSVLALVFALCMPACAQSPLEKQLLDLVNREREKAGLSKLEWSDSLSRASLKHSKLMDEHQDLSHQFAGEASVQERLGATGARFNAVGENVAEAPDVATAHRGLMESPGHRANILHADYNAVGISIVQHGQQLFVTQDFAHILGTYTEKQFRDSMVASFNKARRGRGLPAVAVVADTQLRKAACSQDTNTNKMLENLPGVSSLMVFSVSEPGALPNNLRSVANDPTVDRMNIGVCLQTGGKNGFSKFWVVTAFYRSSP